MKYRKSSFFSSTSDISRYTWIECVTPSSMSHCEHVKLDPFHKSGMLQKFRYISICIWRMNLSAKCFTFSSENKMPKLIEQSHRIGVSSERHEIYHCWNWYGSDLQTLEDQAHWVLKKFHDLDPGPMGPNFFLQKFSYVKLFRSI